MFIIMKHIFRIEFDDVNDCFLHVPLNTSNKEEFAKVVYGTGHTAYFSVVIGKVKDSDNCNVGLSATYAKQLGIKQCELVTVTFIKSLPKLQSVCGVHRSEDLGALDLSKELLEEKVLQQVKVVWPGQIFPLWLVKNFNFLIKVESLRPPCSVGMMCDGTELDLQPQNCVPKQIPQAFQQKTSTTFNMNVEPLEFRACEIPASLMGDQNHIAATILATDWPKCWGNSPSDMWCTLSLAEGSNAVDVLLKVFHGETKLLQVASSRRNILLPRYIMTSLGLSNNGLRVSVIPNGLPVKDPRPNPIPLPQHNGVDWQLIFSRELCKLIEEAETSLELALRLSPSAASFHPDGILHLCHNVLIAGDRGSGRSTIAKEICRLLAGIPHFVHVENVSCRSLVGKKADACIRILGAALEKCFLCEPSVLFLDDLDCLAPHVSHLEEATAEGIHNARISELVSELLWEVGGSSGRGSGKVAVIATALSHPVLCDSLISPRGTRLLTTMLPIPNLETAVRERILLALLGCLKCNLEYSSQTSVHDIALKTCGFVAVDLADLVDRAIFDAFGRKASERDEMKIQDDTSTVETEYGPHGVKVEDLESALSRTVPLSLHGSTLVQWGQGAKSGRVGELWKDVGGLKEAKKKLEAALLWPLKHPKLFKSLPLKLRRGMLLYGPPGTGKTQLVSSLVGHCGLRLINVKGPELLSKYIGASEEAVRNIFKKAHSAQPCILFFDEFESLAPRRGHDSTGVTDRVVNQLLTQLDGVEEGIGDGVFVVAATTRPDLIDPALLRPGRLDTPVLCPIPDEEDRISILVKLSSHLSLGQEVDLAKLSKLTSGFTGADLQAVLYSSQLLSLKSSQNGEQPMLIEWDHILQALEKTRPSLSKRDIEKYERSYTSKDGPGYNTPSTGQKVSLA